MSTRVRDYKPVLVGELDEWLAQGWRIARPRPCGAYEVEAWSDGETEVVLLVRDVTTP